MTLDSLTRSAIIQIAPAPPFSWRDFDTRRSCGRGGNTVRHSCEHISVEVVVQGKESH